MEMLRNFGRDERGQDLIEYALIAVLIAVAAIAGMTNLAGSLNAEFTKVAAKLT